MPVVRADTFSDDVDEEALVERETVFRPLRAALPKKFSTTSELSTRVAKELGRMLTTDELGLVARNRAEAMADLLGRVSEEDVVRTTCAAVRTARHSRSFIDGYFARHGLPKSNMGVELDKDDE